MKVRSNVEEPMLALVHRDEHHLYINQVNSSCPQCISSPTKCFAFSTLDIEFQDVYALNVLTTAEVINGNSFGCDNAGVVHLTGCDKPVRLTVWRQQGIRYAVRIGMK